MSRPGEFVDHALLLRAVDYGESDKVLTILTKKRGKVTVFSAGVRKSSKRYGTALQPFRLLEIRYRSKQDETMGRLFDAKVLEAYDNIAKNLHTMYWASLATEWTAEVSLGGASETLFESAHRLFGWLDGHGRGEWFTEVGCLRFALLLLAESGFFPSFHRCARSGRSRESIEVAYFSFSNGGLLSIDEVRPDDHAVPISKPCVDFLTEIAQGTFPVDRDFEVLREGRSIVLGVLRSILDKDPKSLALLRTVWL